MNLGQLRREVQGIILDDSFPPESINSVLNEHYRWFTYTALHPSLKTVIPTKTKEGQNYLDLSVECPGIAKVSKILHQSRELNHYDSLDSLALNWDMTKEGKLYAYAIEGFILWHVYMPETPEFIMILGYNYPEQLIQDNDSPLYIPDHLQRQTLVYATCYTFFDQIEQDTEIPKTNTNDCWNKSLNPSNPGSGISLYHNFVATQRTPHISSVWRY
jgi:hypothetical protein